MLQKMQQLALSHLWRMEGEGDIPDNLRQWFVDEKQKDPGRFFTYLVEPSGSVEKYYCLRADPDDRLVAVMESSDIGSIEGNPSARLPFNRPDGPRSPQIGPVIKRSFNKQKGAMPTLRILDATLHRFAEIQNADHEWSRYFKEVTDVFSRKKLKYEGKIHPCNHHALQTAIDIIPSKKTVYLTFKDHKGRLPGDIRAYRSYLSTMIDADNKYTIGKAASSQVAACSCCGQKNVKGYPAGISKSGINISNIDREGAFPGITNANAYLAYAICEQCADLLYVFKFHVLENYITYIAGQESLVLPELYLAPSHLEPFLEAFSRYTDKIAKTPEKAVVYEKKKLIRVLGREKATCTLTIVWSKDSLKGSSMGKLSGLISDILPSRLRFIHDRNTEFKNRESPFFPQYRVEGFDFDLTLSFLQELMHRPGGKAAKSLNQSRKLLDVKRMLIETLFKNRMMTARDEKRFWEEIWVTAQWHIKSAHQKDRPDMYCLYEGVSDKKNQLQVWMTFAGWVRHLAMVLDYFNFMGVMTSMKNTRTYRPEMAVLKPYFPEDGGIDSNEKAFAFLLGILFGRVMQVQGAKKVNVAANALTWLKRLTLTGKDLPELHNKIRAKLLSYNDEKSQAVRELVQEAGTLGSVIGDDITLNHVSCCYFLLLGQSMASRLFPGKAKTQ